MDCDEENLAPEIQPITKGDTSMVPDQLSRSTAHTSGETRTEAQRPLRLLRHHRELPLVTELSLARDQQLAFVVESTQSRAWQYALGANASAAGDLVYPACPCGTDRKSTRQNSSHTDIYALSLHDALPIFGVSGGINAVARLSVRLGSECIGCWRFGISRLPVWCTLSLRNHAPEEPYAGNPLVRDCGGAGGHLPALPGDQEQDSGFRWGGRGRRGGRW